MTDLTIPGTVLSGFLGVALLWITKRLLSIAEEAFRKWVDQFRETRRLLDLHVQDCMLRRQSEAQLAEQVANLDDKVCDMRTDVGRLVEHLLK